eukprot:5469175-Amphidinium_carterae.1
MALSGCEGLCLKLKFQICLGCSCTGNIMNSRAELLCVLAHQHSVQWIIEQPGSSLFYRTQAMVQALRAYCRMGDFGAPTPKPTTLLRTVTWLKQFEADCKRKGEKTKAGNVKQAAARPKAAARRVAAKPKVAAKR